MNCEKGLIFIGANDMREIKDYVKQSKYGYFIEPIPETFKILESNLKKCNETYGTNYIPLNYLITNVDNIVQTKKHSLLKKRTVEYYPEVQNLYTQLHSICKRPIIVISSNEDVADFENLKHLNVGLTEQLTEQLPLKLSKPTKGEFDDYTVPARQKAQNIMEQVLRKRAELGARVVQLLLLVHLV